MKTLASILFSIFFLLTTMQQTTYLLLYKLNEKSITEKYCVNKQVKGSCCHGKCHLNKTLAKSENETKNPFSNTNIKVKETEVFFQPSNTLTHPQKLTDVQQTAAYTCNVLDGFFFRQIKPPAVLG